MGQTPESHELSKVYRLMSELMRRLERSSIAEYVEFYRNPRRVVYVNFVGGLARGFGIALGTTVLFAIAVYILTLLVRLNLPVVSRLVADFISLVQQNLSDIGRNGF